MATIILRLDPSFLENPDADIRYVLPDLLRDRSGGVIADDGYDYIESLNGSTLLVLFLSASNLDSALACVLDVIENERIMNNDLRPGIVVAVGEKENRRVIYPHDFKGQFLSD